MGAILRIALVFVLLPVAAAYLVRAFSERDPDFQLAREIVLGDATVLSAYGEIESVRFRARTSHDQGSGVREVVIRMVVDGKREDGTIYVTFLLGPKGETLQSGISDMRVEDRW